MNIIRVFPRKTAYTPDDDMAFVGMPPLIRPDADEVYISCTFTWDINPCYRLWQAWGQYYGKVICAGPGMGTKPNGFTPGLYVKQGVTFTSRGCNGSCPWCLVPEREGKLTEYAEIPPGYIIQDNNFLQCSKEHRHKVYQMLSEQKQAAKFAGGIQASLVTDEIAAEFRDIRISEVFLAADTEGSLKSLEKAVSKLAYLGRKKLRCYMLLGFNGETIEQAEKRLEAAWEIGVLPFSQLYQPPTGLITYSKDWQRLNRTWSRPAATMAAHKA